MASSSQTLTAPSISVRKYIRWLPNGDTTEPTSTIVLTSQSNFYVDVRIKKSINALSTLETSDPKSPLPSFRLHWAFGGSASTTYQHRRQSSSTGSNSSNKKEKSKESAPTSLTPTETQTSSSNAPPAETPTTSHHKRKQSGPVTSSYRRTVWTHWVDTWRSKGKHTKDPSDPARTTPDDWTDAGDIYPTDKDNESLEKGRMINQETGAMTDYEELWKDLPLQKLGHEPSLISFVLRAENTALGTRGMIVRIGSWCQGVICSGSDFGVERWKFGGAALGSGGDAGMVDGNGLSDSMGQPKWERLVKIGEMSLPCQVCWEKCWELGVGEEIVSGGLKWKVIEKVVWKE